MPQLAPYFDLTPAERDAVHAWVTDHGFDPKHISTNTPTYDRATGEWTFTRYLTTDDGNLAAINGEPATVKATITPTRPLPWRTV